MFQGLARDNDIAMTRMGNKYSSSDFEFTLGECGNLVQPLRDVCIECISFHLLEDQPELSHTVLYAIPHFRVSPRDGRNQKEAWRGL